MLFYAFKVAVAIVFLRGNAVEAIQISLFSVHVPLCYPLQICAGEIITPKKYLCTG
jgi:hypothetical protein